jgi:putative ABC transport system permease protein
MQVTPNTRWMRVVGVVRTARLWDLAQQGSTVGVYYLPYAQNPGRGFSLAMATSVDPAAVNSAVRSTIHRLDSELALFDVRTMEERLQMSVTTRRTAMSVALVFGALALFLSALGIYGVLAYFVANRAHEIGIRMAIGSTQAEVFRLILKEGVVLVAIGLTVGLLGSIALRDAVASQLYGVGGLHAPVVAAATIILAGVALAACAIPAGRAAKTDPARVLTQA